MWSVLLLLSEDSYGDGGGHYLTRDDDGAKTINEINALAHAVMLGYHTHTHERPYNPT